jgi:hypothetical protein
LSLNYILLIPFNNLFAQPLLDLSLVPAAIVNEAADDPRVECAMPRGRGGNEPAVAEVGSG